MQAFRKEIKTQANGFLFNILQTSELNNLRAACVSKSFFLDLLSV